MRVASIIFVFATCCLLLVACGGAGGNNGDDGGRGMGMGDGGGLPPLSDGGACTPAPDAGVAAPPGATLRFMDPCTDHNQCPTGLCFSFNMKGPHCSAPCTEPCQCPAPSAGCSNMGICRVP